MLGFNQTSKTDKEGKKMINLLIILSILLFSLLGLKKLGKPRPKYDFIPDEPQIEYTELTYKQYMNQLEWMFKMGIISVDEYNQYQRDGSIFLK
jgi:hypothetical protein